jgi:hypothetical protein
VPNTYIKPEKYVGLALAMLERDTVLPNIVTRYDGAGFIGAKDDTVTIRTEGITKARDYEFRTRTNPIVMDEIYRNAWDIKLDTHTYSAVGITDEELTLDISSFGEEVLSPQMVAIRERLEGKVVTALGAAPFKITDLDAAEATDDPYRWALGARSRLNAQGTPRNGRVLLVGTAVEPWLLDSDKLIRMDPSQAQSAFREATQARMAGFDILSSELIDEDAIYALHSSWAVLANLAPEVPQGVTFGARRAFRGYSLRVIRDYDPNYLRDRSVLSTFTGINSINDEYDRYTAADQSGNTARWQARPSGYGVGDIVITDGKPVFTAFNVRGAKGTFTPAA